eukprot:scaffold1640_cov111-Isochrysis_galbana.AAC.6
MPGAAVKFDCGASGSAELGTLRGGALCASPPPYPDYPRSHNRSRSGSDPTPEIRGPLTQASGDLTTRQWKIIASRYNNSLLTPRDYHLHFKHITHRRIGTNNRFVDQPSTCRFCHKYAESSVHLGRPLP